MFVVKYSGPFGFIKPWTAVRDTETFSQQFLTPSIIEGIEKKLFPELLELIGLQGRIIRHRLSYAGISRQQEQTQPRAISMKPNKREGTVTVSRSRSILTRGVMLEPILSVAFATCEFAERASTQHICLSRNEDVLLPIANITETSEEEFDTPGNGFDGFELLFGESKDSFIVGYNRFNNAEPMYGSLHIVGNPIHSQENMSA